MRGLCHRCLSSNVEVSVLRGVAVCAGCAQAADDSPPGAPSGGEKR